MYQPVWYLAHPVASSDRYTVEENIKHVAEVQRILLEEAGVRTCIPWYSWVAAVYPRADKNPKGSAKLLEEMLVIDAMMAGLMKRVLLTGDRINPGMAREAEAARALGGLIIDLTGVPDRHLAKVAIEHRVGYGPLILS